jgi:hypothetical protein
MYAYGTIAWGLHPTKLEVIYKAYIWRQALYIFHILCINILYFNIKHNLKFIQLLVL